MIQARARRADDEWEEPGRGEPISGAVPAARTSAMARSEAKTRGYGDPGADPFAETVASFGTGSSRRRPEWCVDFGLTLATMTTFELWNAVERGDVGPALLVWREGMECWTPVGRLAEFSWAMRSPAPAPVKAETEDLAEDLAHRALATLAADEPVALEQAAADATTGPALRVLRALSVDEDEPVTQRSAQLAASGWRAWRRLPRAAWVALGSAVALGAIAWALAAVDDTPAAPELASAEVSEVGAETARMTARPIETATMMMTPTMPAPPAARPAREEPRALHDERGQRRRR